MRRWRRLVCWFRGHREQADDLSLWCVRCGCDTAYWEHGDEWFETLPERFTNWAWLVGYRIRSRAKRLREWLLPCNQCGKRFCPIPNDDDHIPF